jgi:beta-N-acetylhexosaminidase
MKKYFLLIIGWVLTFNTTVAQSNAAQIWADSVFKTLSPDERIAQLMVVRLSSIDSKTKVVSFYDREVNELVKKYNIGGVCLFQGSPVKQANALNTLQALAKTPILMCIDAEWGLGMRMIDSVLPLPKQMMLGAMSDATVVYNYGKIVAEQCKRMNIQVNYAPAVDVNNNPNNPVINERSFGEDKYKVALYGIQYMKGMQDNGVMACAKHFPGHGDVAVDSHYDLPLISKSREQLDSLELFPFREIFKAGVSSAMIAHLSVPAIDNGQNKPTSISSKAINELMRNEMGYQGLTFTDALEMQGVKKFYPDGEASVEALIAGNDMLCLPGDVAQIIAKVKLAIKNKRLTQEELDIHCKKVLLSKYQYGCANIKPINTINLTADLNSSVSSMRRLVAENAITILKQTDASFYPLAVPEKKGKEILYVCIGSATENEFAKRMKADYNADVIYMTYAQAGAPAKIATLKKKYKKIVIGVHGYARVPANNFNLSTAAVNFVKQLQAQTNAITFVFGNPYAIKNWCGAKNLVACYEDDAIVQSVAVDLLEGKIAAKGTLPVTVCPEYKYGSGIASNGFFLPRSIQTTPKLNSTKLQKIDAIANDAIAKGATPGCVVLVAKNGVLSYFKAFGNTEYNSNKSIQLESVYDMASVTKVCATTISVMRLYDEGKIELDKRLGDYLPWVKGSNKENLSIKNILLHQAGLVAYIPFYKETIDSLGNPSEKFYSKIASDSFSIRVAQDMYMRTAWRDTIYQRILNSPLNAAGKYIYSDNDFIFLGKIVEAASGMPLNEYVVKEFYKPMGLTASGFKPRDNNLLQRVVPTEDEKIFRQQLLTGDVHDPGAAMFGGVAGHAGLYSTAYDLSMIMQMLMNGGTINNKRFIRKETVELFTAYHSSISRRGYGFDKPEKDNDKRQEPYPCLSASPQTFGHTGFTGTCVWADPAQQLVYVFLSNRVNPNGGDNRKLLEMNVRPKIHEAVYKAIEQ